MIYLIAEGRRITVNFTKNYVRFIDFIVCNDTIIIDIIATDIITTTTIIITTTIVIIEIVTFTTYVLVFDLIKFKKEKKILTI